MPKWLSNLVFFIFLSGCAALHTTSSGLQYKIIKNGEGAPASKGNTVYVHYIGKLTNGQEFDNSYTRNEPFSFVLGKGQVIAGWDEGIALLNKGAKARFIIPPTLGYGQKAIGNIIPANSTLIFEVEIVDIKQ